MQVLVVRQDLKMGAGKIASQCARKFISKWTHAVYLVHLFFFALSIGFCTSLKKMYNLCDCLICNRQILARAALNFCYMYWTFEPTYTSFVANLLQMQRLACTPSCYQGVNAVCTVSSLGSFSWRMSDVYFSLHRHKYSFIMLLYTMWAWICVDTDAGTHWLILKSFDWINAVLLIKIMSSIFLHGYWDLSLLDWRLTNCCKKKRLTNHFILSE